MADKNGSVEKGEYVIGIAIILAALLVSATIYVGVGDLKGAIAGIKLTAPAAAAAAAGAQQAGATAGAQQPAAQAQASQGDWSWVVDAPSIGPKDAKVTVIEFADFQCPYCGIVYGLDIGGTRYDPIRGTATKIVEEYAKAGKVRFVYQPMAFLGQESVDAANAAYCAREIGGDEAFFKMHDKIFDEQKGENEGTFSKANLKKFAAEAGFNSAAMASCIDSGKYDSLVAQSTAQSNGVGVQGTPSFGVNGQILPNGAEYASLKSYVDSLLASQ